MLLISGSRMAISVRLQTRYDAANNKVMVRPVAENPYTSLGAEAFWRNAVGALNPLQISGLWAPKFQVTKQMKLVTAGSCFAQHFSRALIARGYPWLDAEPAPSFMSPDTRTKFNYGIFSFRTGNIYTAKMLRQWVEIALDMRDEPDEIWQEGGRFFDPLRPAIEPGGFASEDELRTSRAACLSAIRSAIRDAGVFVFTLGLTESWANSETGLEYASCPGTAAGTYDANKHVFVNHRVDAIQADLNAALAAMKAENPALKVLLTVSPVPLTASASGTHVLTATTYSKSVLRAVAGMTAEDSDWVDYFPSYEIITAPAFRGMFYAPNQRNVVSQGVDFVMKNFFADQEAVFGKLKKGKKAAEKPVPPPAAAQSGDDVICEEEMLNAFAK